MKLLLYRQLCCGKRRHKRNIEKIDNLIKGEMDMSQKIAELLETLSKFFPDVEIMLSRAYGMIHKSQAAEIHGIKGFLIWDYILLNEITFKDMDQNIISLFKSFSDKETEEKWDELVEKYGK